MKNTTVTDLKLSMILFLVLFLFLFLFIKNDTCKIMVNCRQCTYPSILPFHGAGFQDHDRLAHTCRTPWSVLQKSGELWARPPVLTAVPSQANHSGFRRVRLRNIAWMFRLLGRVSHQQQWKNHKKLASRLTLPGSTAMHRSKLDIGGADAGTGGMSISSSSGDAGASGMGASSASSDASVMGHSTGSAGAGSGSMRFANKSPVACSSLAFFTGLAEIVVAACAQLTTSGAPSLVLVQEVHDCAQLSSPCLVHHDGVERAVENGAGKSGARLRLDAALEAAEDGHVERLQVRRASWRGEAQHDVRKRRLHGGKGSVAGVDARHAPRLSFLAWVHHVVQSGRELQYRGSGVCSGQGCSGKTASVLPVCTICTRASRAPRSMLKATVNVVA